MPKPKQPRNKFDMLDPRENSPQIGGALFLISSGVLFRGIWGKSEFYKALQAATQKQDMINWGGISDLI